MSLSLFEDKTVFTLDKPNKIPLSDWKWFAKNASHYNSNLLIFYEGDAPATIIRNLTKNAKIEKFDLPRIIFNFLDSFYPSNSKNCIKLLNELTKNEPLELIFHLLSLRMRELYWVKVSPQTLDLPLWRKSKLTHQASQFTYEKLKKIIHQLVKFDQDVKKGTADLKTSLDMFIVTSLK